MYSTLFILKKKTILAFIILNYLLNKYNWVHFLFNNLYNVAVFVSNSYRVKGTVFTLARFFHRNHHLVGSYVFSLNQIISNSLFGTISVYNFLKNISYYLKRYTLKIYCDFTDFPEHKKMLLNYSSECSFINKIGFSKKISFYLSSPLFFPSFTNSSSFSNTIYSSITFDKDNRGFLDLSNIFNVLHYNICTTYTLNKHKIFKDTETYFIANFKSIFVSVWQYTTNITFFAHISSYTLKDFYIYKTAFISDCIHSLYLLNTNVYKNIQNNSVFLYNSSSLDIIGSYLSDNLLNNLITNKAYKLISRLVCHNDCYLSVCNYLYNKIIIYKHLLYSFFYNTTTKNHTYKYGLIYSGINYKSITRLVDNHNKNDKNFFMYGNDYYNYRSKQRNKRNIMLKTYLSGSVSMKV